MPAARALYERGLNRSQVLTSIYGVDLPSEAALFSRHVVNIDGDPPLSAVWGTLPWELMIPLEQGGPSLEIPSHHVVQEVRAYAQAPHVLLLGRTGYKHALHGSSVIAYDLDELRAGRTTIVGVEYAIDVPETGANFVPFGTSLVAFFRNLINRKIALMEDVVTRGGGYYDLEEIAEVRSHLQCIAFLENELAASVGCDV